MEWWRLLEGGVVNGEGMGDDRLTSRIICFPTFLKAGSVSLSASSIELKGLIRTATITLSESAATAACRCAWDGRGGQVGGLVHTQDWVRSCL